MRTVRRRPNAWMTLLLEAPAVALAGIASIAAVAASAATAASAASEATAASVSGDPVEAEEAGAPAVAAIEPEVLRLREAAWRAWFSGDEAALRAMLPAEFIGIDMDDGPFSGREETLVEARSFRAGGGRLVRLEFPETHAQSFGDVVVLYGRFSVTLGSEEGESTFAGRLTEVFVRRDGRWWHPGWHLDVTTTKP